MRAVVYRAYGGPEVVEVVDRPKPVAEPGTVVVRVEASSVGASDAAFRSGEPFAARLFSGLRRPRQNVQGSDFAGVVDSVGSDVTTFAPGDAVWGATGIEMGSQADYVRVKAAGVVGPRPDGLSATDAAALVDATAMAFLRDTAQLRAGERVLVNGASGAVGTMAVQLVQAWGAEVTAVCSAERAQAVRDLGVQRVVDYRAVDVLRLDERFDIVFDVHGSLGYRRARRILAPTGRYLITVPTLGAFAWHLLTLGARGRRSRIALTGLRRDAAKRADLAATADLVAAGALRAVVEAVYPLDEASAAHAHLDRGRVGQLVLAME
ncbi:NAD(P)-dependent alcohol dehydrogenase [Microbacterium sp. CFBP9034]|uniref:NAD(P)-dependent alcohol dehydrogenase n=1 Tax=Microbacterium sp. CFBP9034 TaxID=3096540 RepID=UPI002A69DD36|nr:NAD(P)-dependent alcohol dehydrogenase [Microbacterium sp. CFBP9034]MDY0907955.1 NAD(P)-dependent alcohol dehydrogenase [Microbacterium sp. CFBP9034]